MANPDVPAVALAHNVSTRARTLEIANSNVLAMAAAPAHDVSARARSLEMADPAAAAVPLTACSPVLTLMSPPTKQQRTLLY